MSALPFTSLLAAALLAGCTEPVVFSNLASEPSVLRLGPEPTYTLAGPRTVVPTSCRSPRASGYGALPPRCNLDLAMAAQIADVSDVAHAEQPGPPSSIPAARAAEVYIYGETVPVAPGTGSGSGRVELAPTQNGDREVAVPGS